MVSSTISRKNFVNTISSMVKDGVFPHFHLCGPHENDVRKVAHEIISPHYINKSFILEIHILDNHSESLLVQTIKSFCHQQAVVTENNNRRPKVVIIHQQNETLTESFVHFLEDRMAEHRVKFVFLTTSSHITPSVLLNKMVSFIIHPLDISTRVGGVDKEDDFYNIIHSETDDEKLSKTILEWSELHCLRLSPTIYEKWREVLVK
tara:strand:- start:1522 stop:2139 length:618 start_codon:yes stop_codon:yes gene_type:complete